MHWACGNGRLCWGPAVVITEQDPPHPRRAKGHRIDDTTACLPTPPFGHPWWYVLLCAIRLYRVELVRHFTAVTPDNMLFFAGRNDDEIESGLAKLPPCTIENKVVVDGVECPIVRSHSLPHGYQWNEKKEVLAHSSIELHNVGHGR